MQYVLFITVKRDILISDFMSQKVLFYKGLHRVKVITESEGYWIVEAQEDFEDYVDGERVPVKAGERRIVSPDALHKEKALSPPIPEHVYERQLEKKVKKMVEEHEKNKIPKK
jgi:hypothetical protein